MQACAGQAIVMSHDSCAYYITRRSSTVLCPAHRLCFQLRHLLVCMCQNRVRPSLQGGQHLISLVLPEQMCLDLICSGSLTHAGARAGMDIAAEVALCGAAKTILSCRRPVHVVPRWVFGKPSDTAVQPWCVVFHSSCIAWHCVHGLCSASNDACIHLILASQATVRCSPGRRPMTTCHFALARGSVLPLNITATPYLAPLGRFKIRWQGPCALTSLSDRPCLALQSAEMRNTVQAGRDCAQALGRVVRYGGVLAV